MWKEEKTVNPHAKMSLTSFNIQILIGMVIPTNITNVAIE